MAPHNLIPPAPEAPVPRWLTALAAVLGAGTALSLLPVLAVGAFLHPFGDDYIFGVPAYYALQHGQSLIAALLRTVKVYWFGWQGTFSGVLAMELMPDAFFYRAYALTPLVMTLALALAGGKLLHTLCVTGLGGRRRHWLALWAGLTFLTVQGMPDPAQSLYWWNGAALYTLFFALTLLLADRLVRLVLPGGWNRPRLAQAGVLAVAVSGGNFVTGLLAGLLVGLWWLGVLALARPRWKGAALVAALYAAGFLTALAAPGNGVRQSTGEGMGVLEAVAASLEQGWGDLSGFPTPVTAAVLALLAPVLWDLAGRCRFTFPLPLAVPVLAFLLYAAMNAPHFYTMSQAGPGRIRDIVYFFYLWGLLLSEGWLLGWLRRHRTGPKPQWMAAGTAALALLTAVILWKNGPWLTAGKAAAALADGSLAQYHQLMLEREALYRDPAVTQVLYSPAMPSQPRLIFVYSVDDTDPEAFPNIAARNYFEKESVACLPSSPES